MPNKEQKLYEVCKSLQTTVELAMAKLNLAETIKGISYFGDSCEQGNHRWHYAYGTSGFYSFHFTFVCDKCGETKKVRRKSK